MTQLQEKGLTGDITGVARHLMDEPNTLTELQACPLATSCLQQLSCYESFQSVANVRIHHELAHIFALHLHGG